MLAENRVSTELQRRMIRLYQEELSQFDITYLQAQIVCVLLEHPCRKVERRALQKIVNVSPSSLQRCVKDLEAKGWVEQKRIADEKREREVVPTVKAAKNGIKIYRCLERANEKLFRGFSKDEIDTMVLLAEKMEKNLKHYG